MLTSLSAGFSAILECIGGLTNAIFVDDVSGLYALLPAIGLALGYGAFKFGIRVIKDIVPNV